MITTTGAAPKSQDIQSSSSPAATSSAATPSGSSSDFDTFLQGILSPEQGNNVSEEDLFAAVTVERVRNLKGDDAAKQYETVLDQQRTALTKPNGFIPQEEAAINALKQFQSQGGLTSDEADSVYSQSFAAAQLDTNTGSLYDSIGGNGDPTVAMASLDVAIQDAKSALDALGAGTTQLTPLSLGTAAPTGAATGNSAAIGTSASAASDGLIFKPVADHGGNLAILLPSIMTGNVQSVNLLDSSGNIIADGGLQAAGESETGREKWNFSQPGGNYPQNITVQVTLSDGTIKNYQIADPSQRVG